MLRKLFTLILAAILIMPMFTIKAFAADAKGDLIKSNEFIEKSTEAVKSDDMGGDSEVRQLQVFIPKDAETLAITGTNVIPEFGIVAALVLTASIVSIITFTRAKMVLD